ncbi:MAG: N-6 DNA methylase, partial [Thermodesulfobacteriota bacterium]|nr:N-6 DNA methylase [Thermodesulfobacteriota bacterium]
MTKEEARQEVAELVARYQSLDERSIRTYSEADTRRTFIEPLFEALGWDVSGREEVTEEESVSRKRVDYAFRLQGIPKFFLEAKSLKADLENPEYAKQAINYAYHKGATWAVLTDFEGLKVFNAEWREPVVSRSLFFELKYDEYLNRLDWLWLLSRPACEQNLLDNKALELFKKTKKTPVGQQLFSDLVSWRGILSKYLSVYNKKYPSHLIDEAVQRILDRLIFIRTCEDREIEPPILRPLLRQWENGAQKNLIQELRHIWRDFDEGYDSRLFLPHLADKLECEPTPFREVISGLYATRDGSIEYDFNAIDADVLGGVYEQYLEHLIKRAGKEVEVIPARGKRKAQGIYYTPKFVVRYIVENTLGPALEGKPLNEVRKTRILDLACGSGSFLVEALDYLGKHWKQQKWLPQSSAEADVKQRDFFDYVTRFQFLTQNLYGVDLDAQAVEIAQLNLLLKVVNQSQRLPDLTSSIRQGNSLISGTEEELRGYFGENWQEKKPFNWEQEFKDIMAQGGFDVVIGNPPYVTLRGKQDMGVSHTDVRYLLDNYPWSAEYKVNSFALFIEAAIRKLKDGGWFGFIIPSTILTNKYLKRIREYMLKSCEVKKIVDLGGEVFQGGIADTIILVLRKQKDAKLRRRNYIQIIHSIEDFATERYSSHHVLQQSYEEATDFVFNIYLDETIQKLVTKIKSFSDNLG